MASQNVLYSIDFSDTKLYSPFEGLIVSFEEEQALKIRTNDNKSMFFH